MHRKTLLALMLGIFVTLAFVARAQAPSSKPMLEQGKTYRLPKDAALVPRHPRDYSAKPHEIDLGNFTNARTLKGGSAFTVRRVREERAGNWYFIGVSDPNAFTPPVKDPTGWLSEADFGSARPEEIKAEAASGSGKGGMVGAETRYLLIFYEASIRASEMRATAEPARLNEWNKWRDESKRARESLMKESGMDNAGAEALARTTPVQDYALWLAQRQLAERVPPPAKPAEPAIRPPSGSALTRNFPGPTPTPAPQPPGSGSTYQGSGSGRQETSYQPRATIRR